MEASADNSSRRARRGWLRRHVVALGVIVALLLLYTLGGFVLVPHIASTQAISYVQHDLQRQLSIGSIKFNPFLFKVEINDLKLCEANGDAIASLSLLRVEFNALASLFHGAWTLGEIRLEQPFVNVLLGHDGSLNLAKLAPPSKQPRPPPSTKSEALPRVRVALFSMQQGRVHFEDHSRGEPAFTATLTPIEFDLTDFRTQPDFENKYRFSAESAAGERFEWAGQFDLSPLSSNGEFSVSALKATTIASYLENSLPCALNSGTLDLKGQYQFVAQGSAAPAIAVTLPSLQAHTLAISPRGDRSQTTTPWISLSELDVNDTKVVLNDRTAVVGEVLLRHPVVQVWREADGTLNLQQLAGTGAAASTPPAREVPTAATTPAATTSATASQAWKVSLTKLSIEGADIAAEDRSVKPALKLKVAPLNLTVQNASSEGTQPLNYDLQTGIGDGGKLHTAGSVTLTPLAAQVSVDLKALDLSVLQPYVAQQADAVLYHGVASSDLKIDYAEKPAKGQPQLKVSGAAEVAALATRDSITNADFVTWSALGASGVKYQMNPSSLDIERVYAKGLYSRVIIASNGTINIKDVMRTPGAPPPAAPAPAPEAKHKTLRSAPGKSAPPASSGPTMPMRIRRIDIEDSTADFTDHSIQPNFNAGITALHGSVVGLSSAPSARAKITLDGSVGDYAPVQIRGEINPFLATGYTDLSMSFHNMELTSFNPYSGKYAGYSIDQGKLSTDMHYHIENRKLDATHHIVIDQLQFGAATESKQAAPLPIKLAVAILKDRNGVITLDLPEITGTIDDPKFKIAPLIWTFVLELMKKVVEAPFAAIGAMFGGGHELSYVDFEPGSAMLADAAAPKLAKLSSALVEKPQLKLDVPLHATGDLDVAALSKVALDQAVSGVQSAGSKRVPKGNAGASLDQTARLDALLAIYRQKLGKEPEYPGEDNGKAQNPNDPNATAAGHIEWLQQQLLPQFKPSADDLNALGKARAEAVQGALLTNKDLPPERVFLTERASEGTQDGLAHMELKLQ
jgi:hypothetical protein